jgi:hypothetical protein
MRIKRPATALAERFLAAGERGAFSSKYVVKI